MSEPTEKPAASVGPDSAAIGNRGLSRSPRETNVARGTTHEVLPARQFRMTGLDIGSADFRKAGVGEGFSRVTDAFRRTPGSQVVVWGVESPSVHRGPRGLAEKRAEAVAAALVRRGIPRDAISTKTLAANALDPRELSPEQKAAMRGATVELLPPPRRPHDEPWVKDDARLLKRAGYPIWPSIFRPYPDAPRQLIVDDPARAYNIARTRITRQDLVTVGQMLEEERDTGTLRAAQLFTGTSLSSDISWGRDEGGGNVFLPLRGGGVVDIDWLNTIVGHGATDPESAALAYSGAKLGWAIAHGLATTWSSGFKGGANVVKGHLRAFSNPTEAKAVQLAGRRAGWEWTYTDILHPDLVRAANDSLETERARRAAKRRPSRRENY